MRCGEVVKYVTDRAGLLVTPAKTSSVRFCLKPYFFSKYLKYPSRYRLYLAPAEPDASTDLDFRISPLVREGFIV